MLDSIYQMTLNSLKNLLRSAKELLLAPLSYLFRSGHTALKFFQKSISLQPRVGKYSYLQHRYLLGLAFIPRNRTLGFIPGDRDRGQNLAHTQEIRFLR